MSLHHLMVVVNTSSSGEMFVHSNHYFLMFSYVLVRSSKAFPSGELKNSGVRGTS